LLRQERLQTKGRQSRKHSAMNTIGGHSRIRIDKSVDIEPCIYVEKTSDISYNK